MTTANPILFLFWTYKAKSRLSRLIAAITRCPWSHMGIGIHQAGLNRLDRSVYFEALLSDGFSGPKPYSELERFLAKDPDNRLLVINLVGVDRYSVIRIQTRAGYMTDTKSYAKLQLLWLACSERYGLPVPRSKSRVTCSESAAELIYPVLDLRDNRRKNFDAVTPGSAYHRLLEWNLGIEHLPGLVSVTSHSQPQPFRSSER